MDQFYLPLDMRFVTLEERKQFYTDEFDLQKVSDWFGRNSDNTRFAVIMGKHTKVVQEKYREDSNITIIIGEYKDMTDVVEQIIDFLPEAVYYDRTRYADDGTVLG